MDPSASFPTSDEADKPCNKCGVPPSWAAQWRANLSYKELERLACLTYDASPRMWPIGYILESPYSPFHIEREMPERNWRDAFEGLLTFESGGTMIDLESRKRQAVVARRLDYENIALKISWINQQLTRDAETVSIYQQIRAMAASKEKQGKAKNDIGPMIDDAIPRMQEHSQVTAHEGQGHIGRLKDMQNKEVAASTYLSRGQWITSLVLSGAITGWSVDLFDSSDGDYFGIFREKIDEDGQWDGISCTGLELAKLYEDGIPMESGAPVWNTSGGRYPDFSNPVAVPASTNDTVDELSFADAEHQQPSKNYEPIIARALMKSVVVQTARAERTKLPNGRLSVNAIFSNVYTDGTMETRQVEDNAAGVLEEMNRARESMARMHEALNEAEQKAFNEFAESRVKDYFESQEESD